MTKLRCSAVRCEYNSDQCCCRPDVKIGGGASAKCSDQTCCDSFCERTDHTTNSACFCNANNCLLISCTASHCRYNQNGNCSAENVTIGGSTAKKRQATTCDTFVCDKGGCQ